MGSHSDLKFFTNEPERDLYTRFKTVLESGTQFFDVLVGYFRSSGFFRLWPAMEQVEKIRILVGLDVDNFTVKIIDRARDEVKYTSVTRKDGLDRIQKDIEDEFAQSRASAEIEKGVRIFLEWLKSGKLEMRMYTDAPIHAKVYIMRKDPEKVPDQYGSIITGSSNFSEAGLVNNLEFNVELKDSADVDFALERFEALWSKATDIRDAYIDTVTNKTWMRDDITPYELYLKTLYEFFEEEINEDKEKFETLLPDEYMRLQYQIDAVTQAWKKLNAYGGVFISDVVGLGKTYICAMLAKRFPRADHKLVICPPVLVDYWREVLSDFDVARCEVVSLGKLDSVVAKGFDKYTCVFVDEAHRFRNSDTQGFALLHQICRGKKVVLISATPINNYTSDIENQLYLFQSKQSCTIGGIRNLEGFFRALNGKLAKLTKGSPEYMAQLRANAEVIRDKILREVMIRRTRSEIVKYYADDMEKQHLSFPKVGTPEKIIYTFDGETNRAFTETILAIKNFKYARYSPLLYLKDTKKYSQMLAAQRNMGGFMKSVLVKRLESSFYAFGKTLSRFVRSYKDFIKMAESGVVYISKKVDVYDLLDDGDLDKLLYYVEQQDVMQFDISDFKPELMRDLRADYAQLQYLQDLWSGVQTDPKLDEFKRNLSTNEIMKGKKLIVFTESKETAEYLCEHLQDIYAERVVYFSGESGEAKRVAIEDSFNPKSKEHGRDLYDCLITTDVLAEGINLHRANIVVNYDLPWNPTRIMQRVGRINRVGTEHDRIYVFNFFPTAQSEAELPMEERILEKLQAFHDTLGEDYKYLSDEEVVSPKKLFDELNADMDEDEESTNPELGYLAVIRGVRDNDPKLFERVKRLPKKAKAGKNSDLVTTDSTIGFIRKGALKTFFLSDGENPTRQLSFMEAIRYIESEPADHRTEIGSGFYDQYDSNSAAFDEMLNAEDEVSTENVRVAGNDAKVIRILKAMRNEPTFTDDQETLIDTLIRRFSDGDIPDRIGKDIVKKSKVAADLQELYFEIKKLVPQTYLEEKQRAKTQVDEEKQVILSCYLKGSDI